MNKSKPTSHIYSKFSDLQKINYWLDRIMPIDCIVEAQKFLMFLAQVNAGVSDKHPEIIDDSNLDYLAEAIKVDMESCQILADTFMDLGVIEFTSKNGYMLTHNDDAWTALGRRGNK